MMQLSAYGDRGSLLSALSDAERRVLCERFEYGLPPGYSEYVPGYDSILLIAESLLDPDDLLKWLNSIDFSERASLAKPRRIVVPVCYDGSDLELVAERTGFAVEEVIRIHSEPVYTVRMMGFSPGFPYLDGLDGRLQLDRRASPRNRIAAGAVAIGGQHAGIYSVASPGGWHILGRTDLPLFNLEAAEAMEPSSESVFTLKPGDELRFEAVTGS